MAPRAYSAQDLVNFATQAKFLNTPYIDHTTIPSWGPGKGWDCSSFTSYVLGKYGVKLPAYSDSQFNMGTPVARKDLRPGDLVFFKTNPNKQTGHVGIYIGNGMMVNAANSRRGTVVQSIDSSGPYVGARRYINVTGQARGPQATAPDDDDDGPEGDARSQDVAAGVTDPANTPVAQADNLERDRLSAKELAAQYGFAARIMKAVPELWDVFKLASKEGWTDPAKIVLAIRDTDWYKKNNEYAREAWMAKWAGGADWKATQADARITVQRAASAMGANLTPAELETLVDRYIFEGWGKREGGQAFLQEALSGDIETLDNGYLGGSSGNIQENLAQVADRNGLKLNQSFYESAARAVAAGTKTYDDFEREVRAQAASLWPTWTDKIMAGVDAADLAQGYITKMAEIFEVDSNTIKLNDPYLRQAMTATDDKGNPAQVGLWEFENKLRQDPRWMQTKQAADQISNIGLGVLRSFGLMG